MELSSWIFLFQVLAGSWLVSELIRLIRQRANRSSDQISDRGTEKVLWLVFGVSLSGAGLSQMFDLPRLPAEPETRVAIGCVLLVLGVALRWTAIRSLGRWFTVNVAIRQGHELMDQGLYRYLRHPSYTGILISFLGLGIGFGNWLSLALAVIPTTLALLRRIHTEERVLAEAFGGRYLAYQQRTHRLFPWVY